MESYAGCVAELTKELRRLKLMQLSIVTSQICRGYAGIIKKVIGPAYSILEERRQHDLAKLVIPSDNFQIVEARGRTEQTQGDAEEEEDENDGDEQESDKQKQFKWESEYSIQQKKLMQQNRREINEECHTIEKMLKSLKDGTTANLKTYSHALRDRLKHDYEGNSALIMETLENFVVNDTKSTFGKECKCCYVQGPRLLV
jgi:hypothetical protein